MSEWNDYFEDFPEENPANQKKRTNPLDIAKEAVNHSAASKNNDHKSEIKKMIQDSESKTTK